MTEYFDKDDNTLVELTLLGKEQAYEELVTRHERSVKGTAYKITRNEFSAEDAAQDAFVSAWMNLSSLRERDKFGSWVCSIAKNCARTLEAHYRSTMPDISLDLLENLDLTGSDESGLLGMLSDDGKAEEVRQAVSELSEKIREAVSLHYFEGLSVKQIAAKLSLPEGTVKWRLSEGRKQLRKGYGVMEKTYEENEALVARVMRQVEQLKLWRLKNDRSGFEAEYREVLAAVESLADSKEKSHALADVLIHGYWWIPGEKNDEVMARIKKTAEEGHNDDVMESVVCSEHEKLEGQQKIDFMLNTQIPYLTENKYRKSLGYVWFWLGYAYRQNDDIEKALEAFGKVLEILTPSDVYYANALAAIGAEKRVLESKKSPEVIKTFPHPTGEVFRYVGGKLYFWQQPGYGCGVWDMESSLFWNCSGCDSIIYDPDMLPGDKITSSNGKVTLTYTRDNASVDTTAGRFSGCSVFTLEGNHYGVKYCETYFCPGVGIVSQIVERRGARYQWQLSEYSICGGNGFIPFAAGNCWKYVQTVPDNALIVENENIFETTAFENGMATVSAMSYTQHCGYRDTWEGKIIEARNEYCDRSDKLCDVEPALRRAGELAVTPRQKRHTEIASEVMRRIMSCDPETNPGYTEKGRWNFFEYDAVTKKNGRVCFDYIRRYCFEWKDMARTDSEGKRVLYNFLYDILHDAADCVWSDEWVPGYKFEKNGQYPTKDFCVLDEESVTTPAGTFEDCRHITFERQGLKGGAAYRGGRFDYWFAPGVGIVKFSHPIGKENVENIWQLTEYLGTGDGYFPIDDGLFRRYEPHTLGNGWHGSVEYTFDKDEGGTVMFRNALGTQDRAEYEADKAKAEAEKAAKEAKNKS